MGILVVDEETAVLSRLGHGCASALEPASKASHSPAMMALPTPEPSSAWCVMMFLPFSPKMSTSASCTRLAKLGYFYRQLRSKRNRASARAGQPTSHHGITHVVQRTVRTDRTSLVQVSLLANDRGNTTGRKSGGSSTNQHGELLEELSLLECRLDTEEVREDTDDSEQLVRGVTGVSSYYQNPRLNAPLHERQESRVKRVSLLELVRVLAQEQVSSVDQVANDQTEDLSEIQTGNHLLESLRMSSAEAEQEQKTHLLVGLVGRLVDNDVVLCSRCLSVNVGARVCV